MSRQTKSALSREIERLAVERIPQVSRVDHAVRVTICRQCPLLSDGRCGKIDQPVTLYALPLANKCPAASWPTIDFALQEQSAPMRPRCDHLSLRVLSRPCNCPRQWTYRCELLGRPVTRAADCATCEHFEPENLPFHGDHRIEEWSLFASPLVTMRPFNTTWDNNWIFFSEFDTNPSGCEGVVDYQVNP